MRAQIQICRIVADGGRIRLMGLDNSFRLAGTAGGEENQACIIASHRLAGWRRISWETSQPFRRHLNEGRDEVSESIGERGVADQDLRVRAADDRVKIGGRVSSMDGDVGPSGSQDGKSGHDCPSRFLEAAQNKGLRMYPQLHEVMREPRGEIFQLSICQIAVPRAHRYSIGMQTALLQDYLMHAVFFDRGNSRSQFVNHSSIVVGAKVHILES